MSKSRIILITGTRKGIGAHLVEHYIGRGFTVMGCSRHPSSFCHENYQHNCLDITNEDEVRELFKRIRSGSGHLDALINNAGIGSMNHALLTPLESVRRIMDTNVVGTFLFCREAAKLMRRQERGRIVNLSSVAVPLKLEGEAAYAGSKAAVNMLTQILARELAPFRITVNAVGPAPVRTDLLRGVPEPRLHQVLEQQAIHRYADCSDVANVIDFFMNPASDLVTGQVIYLGGP
jgi:3-oxoacyl-[acyl-carrier protein] reductase